jgi:hypothetical protein
VEELVALSSCPQPATEIRAKSGTAIITLVGLLTVPGAVATAGIEGLIVFIVCQISISIGEKVANRRFFLPSV